MAVAQKRPPRRLTPTPKPDGDQLRWIHARDRIGYVIDSYLRVAPGEVRPVLLTIEQALADGDHLLGLL